MSISDKDIIQDFLVGFIRLHILRYASQRPVFGLLIIQELAKDGYNLSPGTLYPMLHQLEDGGLLYSRDIVIKGKRRKYYRTTDQGLQVLESAGAKIRSLVGRIYPPEV